MIHLFSMLGSFISSIAGRVVSSQIVRNLPAPIKQAPISNHEKELVQLRKELANRKQDAELKKRELELQAKISMDNLRLMQKHHIENVDLKLKEIQANYDVQHWAGILSREETIDILKQGQQENRFLILLSPPDVSPSCPLTFQHDLGKTLRGKVKEFVETYYPRNSAFPVQFFGKFFKSSIFDTEAVQLENLLSPVPTAVIFSDLTNKELLLHIHVWGMMGGKLSLSSSFEWKAEYKKLLAEGKDEEEALDEIQTAMVQMHKLLSGFLTDLYFLQANPLHKPQLFLIDKSIYPVELTKQLLEQLKQLQQSKLKEYEQLLLEKQRGEQDLTGFKNLSGLNAASGQKIGKFIVNEGIATDTVAGLMWCRFALGQEWKNGTVEGDAKTVNWDDAFEITKLFNQQGGYGGFTDWRLPTIDELKTLIDIHYKAEAWNHYQEKKSIDDNVFPSNGCFWSSSPNDICNNCAWVINFFKTECTGGNDKNDNYAVQLVRGGQ